ncbi:MAG: N-acetylneuraminate synthase family protein [Desulfobacter sp.]
MTDVTIVAEAGINHNGEISLAKQMIDAAAGCGADVIKFQTFRAEEFVSDPDQTYTYMSQGKQVTESMLEMFKRYEFSEEDWCRIISHCQKTGIRFCSTAQNTSDLDFLLTHADLPFIKVGSDDLTNLALLSEYGGKNIPLVLSAGMSYPGEIHDALETVKAAGCRDVTVLHCVSEYPAAPETVHLSKIPVIRDAFGVRVGFSDHTTGSAAAVGAVCFGATFIEKHFTLDNGMAGPDHWFSADVDALGQYVSDIRSVIKAIGRPTLVPSPLEQDMRRIARRKIVAGRDLDAGHRLCEGDICLKRSDRDGMAPKEAVYILGRTLDRPVTKGRPFQLNDFK